MKSRTEWGLLFLVCVWGAIPCSATMLFDNGTPDLEAAFFADTDGYGMQCAENFFGIAGSTGVADITGIEWFGVYYGNNAPEADAFTISFYTLEAGSRPAFSAFRTIDAGAANRIDTGIDFLANGGATTHDVYSYSVDISALTLNMSGTYFISISNSSPASSSSDDWLWCSSNNVGGRFWYRYGYDMWYTSNDWPYDLAFNLTGEIHENGGVYPEPSSVCLVAIGLAGLAARRFRNMLNAGNR